MAHCIHWHAVCINFRNINQLKLHCSFDSILFVTIIVAVLDVDGVADKYSRKSNAHIMSSSWPSSKFSMINAAHAIQISLSLRPLLRIKINWGEP